MKNTLREDQVKEKLGQDDMKKLEEAISGVLNWLDMNMEANVDEYEYKRKELEEMVKENGGVIKKVSKNLSFLVSGDGVQKGKYLSALKLGVDIISERDFLSSI